MWRIFAVIIVLAMRSLPAFGQTVVTGNVKDQAGDVVEGAMVKLYANGKMVAYSLTDENGSYTLRTKNETSELTITAEHLSYAKHSGLIDNKDGTYDIVLAQKAMELKEVTVSAPMIYVRGDTLTFRLDAFKGKGDISLKDAMKKIPGIEIEDDGRIKYLGRAISHFYIEGLDLLGGKYNVATENIPADYVSAVQVLNNHKDAKVDKNTFSDDVAINVKIEPWAKFRPMGTYEVGAGYGDRFLYKLTGAGMMFNKNFQSIITGKTGNVEEFASQEGLELIYDQRTKPRLKAMLGDLSASKPPFKRKRYASSDDHSVSINLLNKINDNVSVKTNAGYAYSKSRYEYSTVKRYFDGEGDIVIDQRLSPVSRTHNPSLSVEYKDNSEMHYVIDRFKAEASFFDASLPTIIDTDHIGQQECLKTFDISNDFSGRWRRGRLQWDFGSQLLYQGGPSGHVDVFGGDVVDAVSQSARNSRFETRERLAMIYESLNSRIHLPLEFHLVTEHIDTWLERAVVNAGNDVSGEDMEITFSPRYEYTHPRQIVNVHASVGLSGRYYNFRNGGSHPVDRRKLRFCANPDVYFNYRPDAKSTIMLRAEYSHDIGDILDMLTSPIATDYLNLSVASGVVSEQRTLSAQVRYEFKMPVEMLFFNASGSYSRSRLNVLAEQKVDDGIIGAFAVGAPNHSDEVSARATITKQVQSIGTKLSLGALIGMNRHEILENDEVIRYTGRNFSVSPSMTCRPIGWLEFNYRGSLGKTYSAYGSVRRSFFTQTHDIALSLFPLDGLTLTIDSDISRRELDSGVVKVMSLVDAEAAYKFKKIRFGFKISNLLNRKSYSYTVFSGLNSFTYDYALRGREFLLSVTFTK